MCTLVKPDQIDQVRTGTPGTFNVEADNPVMKGSGTVLIVGESGADFTRLRTVLSEAGYIVVEAPCGSEAVARAVQTRPHLIVLDESLPDHDGLEVCRAIRADRYVGSVPIVMLTSSSDDSSVVAGLGAGADDYFDKHAAPELIVARIRRLIHYKQLAALAVLNRQLVQMGRLLTGVIHEIRGPLSVIRGSAELLRLNVDPNHDEMQWIDSILRGTQVLQVRLENFMAAVRSGPPQVHPVDLYSLLHEAVDLFIKGLSPNDRGIQIHAVIANSGLCVRADGGRIIQVLIDLLNNAHQAISSLRNLGRIELHVTDEPAAGTVKIQIIDDGPGIPELHLGRLFEPFFSTRENGTGYGLYLANEIIQEQGGQLSACNNDGEGACFTICLPRVMHEIADSVAATNAGGPRPE